MNRLFYLSRLRTQFLRLPLFVRLSPIPVAFVALSIMPPVMNDGKLFSSSRQNKQPVVPLDDVAASQKLRENQESYYVHRGQGVVRYDICQLPSNNPIEDDHSELIVEAPLESGVSDWSFWGVYDGHSGWYTSAKLREELIKYVALELSAAHGQSSKVPDTLVPPSDEEIDAAIKRGFVKLDDAIIKTGVERAFAQMLDKRKAATELVPGISGACGLLAYYDLASKKLRVAVTGDSRALLGLVDESGRWTVRALSTDQTGSNKHEAARIRAEHPNEPQAVTRGRVLGRLEPSRAFGDGKFKWAYDVQKTIHEKLFSYPPPGNLKTPPYVTAEPEVTTTQIHPENGDFLVLGTDGLYEMLTNEEIAGLVVKWAEKKGLVKDRTLLVFDLWGQKYPQIADLTPNKEDFKPPYRETKGEKKMLLEDENVATHIVRNAVTLGTGDKEYGNMLLGIPLPVSRRYRDDLTVVVVFFGEGGVREGVKVNEKGMKPKL